MISPVGYSILSFDYPSLHEKWMVFVASEVVYSERWNWRTLEPDVAWKASESMSFAFFSGGSISESVRNS